MLTRSATRRARPPPPDSSLSSASPPPVSSTTVSAVKTPAAVVASSSSDEYFSPPTSPRPAHRQGRGRPPAGLGPRSQQAPNRVPAAGGNVSRIRWTQSMNENVMRAYYGATEGGINLTAYRGRMLSLFQVLEPAVNVSAQRLSDQVRVIQHNHRLDNAALDRLRLEMQSSSASNPPPSQNVVHMPAEASQRANLQYEEEDARATSVDNLCNVELRSALEDAIQMCAAIDMLASESFYGHSPPAGFLSDYSIQAPRRPTKLTTRGFSAPCLTPLKPVQLTLKSAPRSCIRIPNETKKKKVVFADDRGFALEQIKFMTEPSHLPPHWTLKFDTSPPPERKPPPQPVVDLWETRFVQPASNYLEFRRRVTQDCVSLENVIVKQNECAVDGTVKVKNLDFAKEVYVRTSSDGWLTSEDTSCAFVEPGPLNQNGVSTYDTFGFRLQLPIHSRRLEFCVSFKCKGDEFWDNNGGLNYCIEKASVRNTPAISCARIKYGNSWTTRSQGDGNVPYW